ncbi:MAG: hypothetical protein PSU94_09795 [Lacunisphaera sp.]|nr:hypothetical protein [Lacunisphaera sp.]
MKNKKPIAPDRVGLSLHKHLVPHVLEKAPVLDMNPNEFVNACVEQCVEGMLAEKDAGPGCPPIVYNYRLRTAVDPQPISQRFNVAEYALLRGLDEVLYDLNLAKECVLTGKTTSAILSPAILELLQQYREKRSHLIAQAQLFGKGPVYPAPQLGI